MSGRGRDPLRLRRYAPLVYLLLLAAGVPWYWPPGTPTLVLGVPVWVLVAVLFSALASVFTAWLLAAPWPGEEGADD